MTLTAVAKIEAETISVTPILTAPMLALGGIMLTAMGSFYLLLSAIPGHAVALGGAPAAGLTTGVLMAATIVGELAAPRLITRLGRRAALALALLIMALPCVTTFSNSLPVVFASSGLRGLGLGVLLVAACGLATLLAPPTRRAEALGVYGVASAIPAIICVPLGPWALSHFGPATMAIVTAALALIGLVGLSGIANIEGGREGGNRSHRLPALRLAVWPSVSLAIGAIIVGATITFLPIAHPEASQGTIMLALLIQGLMATGARWLAGRPIDRHGPQGAAIGGVALVVLSALCLARPGSIAVIIGMAISGIAFGILQSATLAQLMGRATPDEIDGASALWNGAYDAGLGIGGLAFGALAAAIGFGASFLLAAAGLATLAILIFHHFEARRRSW